MVKELTYKIKFVGSYRFMQSKSSKLINNLSGITKTDCIACKERKKKQIGMQAIRLKND